MASASLFSSIARIQEQRSDRRTLLRMLAVALVLRVALGSFIDASGFDTDLMQSWTRTLLDAPLGQFYAVAEGPDHLPGDLWFLWAIGHGLELFGLDNAPRGPFVALMKLVPAVADVVIAWELFALVRPFATSRAALIVAAAFAFNPGGIFLTSIWGQWDSLSMAMLLGGVLVILKTMPSAVGRAGNGALPRDRHPELVDGPHPLDPYGITYEGSPREALGGVAAAPPGSLRPPRGPAGMQHQGGCGPIQSDPPSAEVLCTGIHRSALNDGGVRSGELHAQRDSDVRPDDRPSLRHSERSEESPGEAGPRGGRDRPHSLVSPMSSDALRAGILREAQDDGGGRGREEKRAGRGGVLEPVPLWPLAVPLLTWAVLIKPPLALLAGLFVLYASVRTILESSTARDAIVRTVMAVMMSLVLGIATASLLIVPFDVGLPGMPARWNVLERARYALDLYPFTTLQAANIWMIKDAHLHRPGDTDGALFGLTERTWGSVLLVIALVWIGGVVVVRWRRVPDATLVIWAALATSYAVYMLPTRVHERYFFPVMVLALALSGLKAGGHSRHHGGVPDDGRLPDGARWSGAFAGGDRWTWRLAMAISGIFLISLMLAYDHTVNVIRAVLFDVPLAVLFRGLAVVNLVVFLITLALPLWWGRLVRPGAAASISSVRTVTG